MPGMADEGLIARKVFIDQFVTAQRCNHPRGTHPISLGEFCSYEHVVVSNSGRGCAGSVDRYLAALGRNRRVSLSVQSYALAPAIIANSDHLCTLASRFLRHFESTLDLFMPPLDMGEIELYALWHPRMKGDPAHQWFRNQVLKIAQG